MAAEEDISRLLFRNSIVRPALRIGARNNDLICILAKADFAIPIIVDEAMNLIDSKEKGAYKSVWTALEILIEHICALRRFILLPEKGYILLNKGLIHRTKTVRERALLASLLIAGNVYLERLTSGNESMQSIVEDFTNHINPESLVSAEALNFILSWKWLFWYEYRVGLKRYFDRDKDLKATEECLKEFWPEFTFPVPKS
jgi:hypothetical protein